MSAPDVPPGPERLRILVSLLKICAAVFLTWLALRSVDFARARQIAGGLSWATAGAAMLLLIGQAALSAWRWMRISRHTAARLPFVPAFRLFMLSVFYAQALPSTVPGDAARIWGAARFGGRGEAAVGVFLDRLLTLLALLILAVLSAGALAMRGGSSLAVVTPLLILASAFAILALLVVMRGQLRRFKSRRVGAFAIRLTDAIHRLLLTSDIAGLLAVSLLIHGFSIAIMTILAHGMGLPVSATEALIAFPLVLLAALLPVSIGGWGVREATMVAVLAGFGIGRTEAATLSVVYGLFQLALGIAAGLFFVFPGGGGSVKAMPERANSGR